MELLQLRYFFDSAKNEHFAKTAEKYWVPASSVSASIKRLEEELGCKLFDRQSFAGSVATSDRLFRTVRELTGLPLYEISKMISATPAKAMGYTDRGKIEVGLRADLILMDEKLNINKIFLKGEEK